MRKVEEKNADAQAPIQAAQGVQGAESAPLPHLDQIQRMFGRHDVSAVRAHSASDQAFGAVGAQAYAGGNNVHLAEESEGEEIEGHELTHVVQQRNGRP